MIVKEIKGDLLQTHLNYIGHGVNCQNRMGSGVAKVLFTKYPEVKEKYHTFYNSVIGVDIPEPKDFLGMIQPVSVSDGKFVVNMFTQENYGYDGSLYVSYEAIKDCFKTLANISFVKEIAIPKIGCGLAGGDWDKVRDIINEATGDKLDVYVYYI